LNKCVEEDSNADTSPQKLNESCGSKEFEEADGDHLRGVDDASHHRDEVEGVPGVLEVVLRK
jgi:hypothetical protein